MVNSPREVVGAVLKYMGASYNTSNINLQVAGGRNAVQQNLALLGKQVLTTEIEMISCLLFLPSFSKQGFFSDDMELWSGSPVVFAKPGFFMLRFAYLTVGTISKHFQWETCG